MKLGLNNYHVCISECYCFVFVFFEIKRVTHFLEVRGSSLIHQSGVSSTILKKRLESNLSWIQLWSRRNFKRCDWLFRRLGTRKDWFCTGNQNPGLEYSNQFITLYTDSLRSRNLCLTMDPWPSGKNDSKNLHISTSRQAMNMKCCTHTCYIT